MPYNESKNDPDDQGVAPEVVTKKDLSLAQHLYVWGVAGAALCISFAIICALPFLFSVNKQGDGFAFGMYQLTNAGFYVGAVVAFLAAGYTERRLRGGTGFGRKEYRAGTGLSGNEAYVFLITLPASVIAFLCTCTSLSVVGTAGNVASQNREESWGDELMTAAWWLGLLAAVTAFVVVAVKKRNAKRQEERE